MFYCKFNQALMEFTHLDPRISKKLLLCSSLSLSNCAPQICIGFYTLHEANKKLKIKEGLKKLESSMDGGKGQGPIPYIFYQNFSPLLVRWRGG